MENASYQVFEPAEVRVQGKRFLSAKERNMPKGKLQRWVQALQQEVMAGNENSVNPIVLAYNGNHYSWMKFQNIKENSEEKLLARRRESRKPPTHH
ncbi:hypothetical protein F442_00008 [Phytophthora nicotianae P10297]|uniref:Uncharacterized protein n=4 Tax=Phytophthora nicotianae TaxID=4792 RepID=W2PBU1_PHYN3|nr:hypothetical protein PPTG_24856 [Phytophthora nicotianae INRA-310]ETM57113.1 hypothetical protein L914_00006 [Phytophthora nicotianae]ETM97698.1 hypothetical protein PPTG_24856 [Phytophthora nicotianae INRA-310]ETO86444.1 hypothetical protein F444_00007 [Phytophthora nicotianae P1976]ETP55443.1 hypothetical protein F442_00008 [Phytophthora nicotianae P10297]